MPPRLSTRGCAVLRSFRKNLSLNLLMIVLRWACLIEIALWRHRWLVANLTFCRG